MARHAKTDSDVTSLAPSSPPRSPRRPAYYVHSPAASHPDVVASGGGGGAGAAAETMSLAGSTPAESPLHYHFHHSGAAMHHSRESSTGRLLFSDQLRSGGAAGAVPWRRLGHGSGAGSVGDDDDEEGDGGRPGSQSPWRCYALAAFAFVAVFAFFLLVLWGASKSYKPHVDVKSVVFESYHIQGGTDRTGVPTRMMSVNATVRLRFRNRGTFFGLHVTAAPVHLFFDDLTVASGNMKEFYQAEERAGGDGVRGGEAGPALRRGRQPAQQAQQRPPRPRGGARQAGLRAPGARAHPRPPPPLQVLPPGRLPPRRPRGAPRQARARRRRPLRVPRREVTDGRAFVMSIWPCLVG